MHHYAHTQRASNGTGSSAEVTGSPPLSGQSPLGEQELRGSHKKRVCFDAVNMSQTVAEASSKRLRQNDHFTLQASPTLNWKPVHVRFRCLRLFSSASRPVLLAQGRQGGFGAPDPLDADPLDLMASQSHLLDTTHAARLERGNSSNCQQLEIFPPPSFQELDVSCIVCAYDNWERLTIHVKKQPRCAGWLARGCRIKWQAG